ncbi:MAG: hypothetical protein J3R72DRAFT_7787 [Linnemannia gamsii]|nr:MAG: hypothetical protein J3R72DRAFT_7787 [Linnemannia gamsii]
MDAGGFGVVVLLNLLMLLILLSFVHSFVVWCCLASFGLVLFGVVWLGVVWLFGCLVLVCKCWCVNSCCVFVVMC